VTVEAATKVTQSAGSRTGFGTLLVVFASCSAGTSGPLAKPALDAGLSAPQVTSVRIGLAALILLTIVAVWRPALLRVRRADWRLLVGYGLLGVGGVQLLYFAAVARIPIGIAMLLEYTSPILVALWVRFVRRTALPARMWAGTVVAMVGLAMVAQVWQGLGVLDALGLAAGAGAALCAAAFFLIGERGASTIAPLGMVTWGMIIGAAGVFVLAPPWSLPYGLFVTDADFGGWRVPVWLLLVACAVLPTALAYLLAINAMRFLPANVVSVLGLLEPVVAATLAWLVLGQALTVAQLSGAVVLLGGATVVQLAARNAPRAPLGAPQTGMTVGTIMGRRR
jgi:drug/metabolite transporter (DMT)-like permease